MYFFSTSLYKAHLIITIFGIDRQRVTCTSDVCKWEFLRAATSPLLPKQPKLVAVSVPPLSPATLHLKLLRALGFVQSVLSLPFEIGLPFAIRGTRAVPPWEGNVH